MLAYILTMPNRGSWNGQWSGQGNLYARVGKPGKEVEKRLAGRNFYYRWDDGWGANVEVVKINAAEARKYRRDTKGFCGYDWMIASIIKHDEIICE